ncbi:MAG: hypothetical protein BZ136_07440 [Methanosphaera sp. rholeuAM74]|nr:MAG: hypothetical protein BZ136_07440 [Methanosphaera sp. rholeuAM74]
MTTHILGTVQINSQGKAVIQLDTKTLDAGDYTIKATHNQDDTYRESNTTSNLTLNPQDLVLSIENLSYVEAGQPFSFDVVSSIPTVDFKVSLKINGSTIREQSESRLVYAESVIGTGIAHVTLNPSTMTHLNMSNGQSRTLVVGGVSLKGGEKTSNYNITRPETNFTVGEIYIKDAVGEVIFDTDVFGFQVDFEWIDGYSHGSELSNTDLIDLLDANGFEMYMKPPNHDEAKLLWNIVENINYDGSIADIQLWSAYRSMVAESEYVRFVVNHSNPTFTNSSTVLNEDYQGL